MEILDLPRLEVTVPSSLLVLLNVDVCFGAKTGWTLLETASHDQLPKCVELQPFAKSDQAKLNQRCLSMC
jgi:hypothetical protein